MTREEVQEKVVALAAEYGHVKPEQVTPASHFINDLEYDSLQVVEFIMALEDELEMAVPDEAAEKLMTVGQVIDYVVEHVGGVAATP